MKMFPVSVACLFCLVGSPVAQQNDSLPTSVPPILGMAVIENSGQINEESEWQIRLTVPKVAWQVVGKVVPKRSWPKLVTEVDKQSLLLRMGGPSALSPSYVVDRDGQTLNREEILVKLRRETPVLVSVTGEMPEPYYLQLTYPEALIVILGPREKAPRPDLLPAKKITASKN